MKDAEMHAATILSRIRKHGCVLMLDFDGTLAPLVSDPARARMRASTRRALEAVARCYPVAVITGRALSDVRHRVPLRGVSFVGNHGLEQFVKGKIRRVRIPAAPQRALDTIRTRLRPLARRHKGIYFDDKVCSLSFHYRHSPRSKHAEIRAEVLSDVRKAGNLRAVEGVFVINILPAIRRDKGTAAREMYALLAKKGKPAPVFIGDDVTDEDAFRVLRSGITIRVGKSTSSAARYYFSTRSGVDTFLRAVAAATPSKA